jgi:DNA-binding beta-propeller fold protein YncE
MKQLILALSLTVAAALELPAQPAVPDIPFDGNVDFLKPPDTVYFGEVAGVAVNSKGHVFVFSRGGTVGPAFGAAAAQLFEFDTAGKFVREIGKGMYSMSYAHSVRIDRDDNIWLVDKGSDMIVKLTPAGRVAMVFGRKKEASDDAVPWERVTPPRAHVNGQFRQPTDVTWDTQGNIFISDGYINSRVAKFTRNGDWVKSWGEKGTKDGEFDTPHSIASDARGNIYVADRGNRRIQVFDPDGRHLRSMSVAVPAPADAKPAIGNTPGPNVTGTQAPGAPWALCITPGPNQVLFMSDAFPGRIYKMSLDGQVLGVLGSSGKQAKQFGWIHEIACPSERELYVAELLNWRVQKLTLR